MGESAPVSEPRSGLVWLQYMQLHQVFQKDVGVHVLQNHIRRSAQTQLFRRLPSWPRRSYLGNSRLVTRTFPGVQCMVYCTQYTVLAYLTYLPDP